MELGIPGLIVRHYEEINEVVQLLKGFIEGFEDGRIVIDKVREAKRAEERADTLRRRILRDIIQSDLGVEMRSPIYRLVIHTEDIGDQALHACNLLSLTEELDIPGDIISDMRRMAVFAGRASGLLKDSLEKIWDSKEEALEDFYQIRQIESTVDELEMEVRRKSIQTPCGVWEAVLQWRLLLAIERVVDRIEDASDEAENIIVAQG
jgi:predicted phosphate transport protein (TIGR00153 family)